MVRMHSCTFRRIISQFLCCFDTTVITCVLKCSAFIATIFFIKRILAKCFQIRSQLNIRTLYSKFYSLAFAFIVCQQCVVDTFIHDPAIFIFYFCGIYHVDEAVTLNIKYRIFRILYISVNAPCHARPERRINPSVVYIGTHTHMHVSRSLLHLSVTPVVTRMQKIKSCPAQMHTMPFLVPRKETFAVVAVHVRPHLCGDSHLVTVRLLLALQRRTTSAHKKEKIQSSY